MKNYGKELIMDLHSCNPKKFNRKDIKKYFDGLCKLIDMKQCKLEYWDDYGVPEKDKQTSAHTKGTSAVQFILTSSIVIHTLDILGNVYINIFSCKGFNATAAKIFTKLFFEGKIVECHIIKRR